MRLLTALVLAASVGLVTAGGQEKKDPPADARAEKLKEIQKQFQADIGELEKKFKAADEKGKEKVRDQAMELFAGVAPKALKVAEEKPDDATGLDAMLLTLQFAVQSGKAQAELEKAVDLLAKHHVTSPKAKQLLPLMERAGEPGVKFLRAFIAGAKGDEKGTATLTLAKALVDAADKVGDLAKATALMKDAEAAFETAARDFKDVRVGQGGTVGKEAEGELATVKAVGVGKSAPDVEGTDLDGKKVKLSSYRGKVVVLDFWATWCGPCVGMIPHERELVAKLKGKPFVFLSVSVDDKKEVLTGFLEKTPMPWSHWWDGADKAAQKAYHVQYYPNIFVIDAKGVIRYRHVRGPDMDKAVEALVKEAEAGKGG
jgi:thiol-disulfide isomerase/thioredoxin